MSALPAEQFGPFNLDELFVQIQAGMVLTDSHGCCEAHNARATELLGRALPHGLSLLELVSAAEERNRLSALLDEACRTGTTMPRQRITLTSTRGTSRLFSIIINIVTNQTTDQRYALWFLEPDQETSTALAEAINATIDASTNVLMFASPGLSITHINQACRDFFAQREAHIAQVIPGFAADKLVGSSIDAFHRNPAHPRRILKRLTERAHPEKATHHSRIELAGYAFALMIRPVVIVGQFMGYSVEWRDVTMEQAHETRWQALLDGSQQGIVVLDSAGAVLEANASARDLLGAQPDWQAILGKARPQLFNALEKAMATGAGHLETWAVAQDGRAVYLRCHLKRLPQGPDDLRPHFVMTITDLTDVKHKEIQLAQQEAYWREIIHSATEGIVVLGADTTLYEVNPAYAAMHGYTVDEIRSPGWNWLEALVPDAAERDKAMSHLQHALETGKPVSYEMHQRRKDGTGIFLRVAARKLLRRPEWEQDRLVVVLSDITELKAREAELAQARQYADSILEAAPVALALWNEHGNLELGNAGYYRLFGTTPEAIRSGQFSPRQGIGPEEEARRRTAMVQVLESGAPILTETVITDQAGQRHDVQIAMRRIIGPDGHHRVMAALNDVTPLKEKERELAEQEAYWKEVIHSATEGILVMDADFSIIEMNPTYATMHGYTIDELERPGWNWAEALVPDPGQRDKAREHLQEALVTGRMVTYEMHQRCKEGTFIDLRISARKLARRPSWKTDRLVLILTDITDLKAREKELARAMQFTQQILEAAPVALSIWTEDGLIELGNSAYCRLYGISADDIRNGRFSPDRHLTQAQAVQRMDNIAAALSGEERESEFVIMDSAGQSHVAHVAVQRIMGLDGKPRVLSALSDITELKTKEQTIAQQEAYWRSIIDAAGTGLVIGYEQEDGFGVEIANPAFCELLGYSLEECKTPGFFHRVTPPDFAVREVAMIAEAQRQGKLIQYEKPFIHRDGHVVHVLVTIRPLARAGHVCATFSDITELKQRQAIMEAFMNTAFEGMLIFDAQGHIHEVNQRHANLLGYEPAEMTDPSFDWRREVFHMTPEEGSAFVASLQLDVGQVKTMEGELFRRNGTSLPVLLGQSKLPRHHTWSQDRYIATVFDLSEIKEKERALEEAAAYQKDIFDSITEGHSIFGANGELYEVNLALAAMLGYSKEELLQGGWIKISPSEYLKQDRHFIERALAGETVRYEKEFICKDGHRIPTLLSYRKLERREGWAQDRLVSTVSDISALKDKERKLAEQEAYWRTLFDASSEGLKLLDEDGNLHLVNTAYAKRLGYSKEEVQAPGFDWMHRFFDDKGRALFRARLAEALETGRTVRFENPHIHRDGHVVETMTSLQLIPTALIQGRDANSRRLVLSTMTDIAMVKQKERELAEQQAYWRHFVDIAPVGVVEYDVSGRYYEANPAFCRMLDMSREEICSPNFDWRPYFAETLDQAQAMNAQAMRSGQPVAGELIIRDRHGKRLHVHGVCVVLGQQDHLAAYLQDITPLKQKEAELNATLAAQQQAIDAIGARLASLAQGDLASPAPQDLQGELARLGDDLSALIASLRAAIILVQQVSSDIRNGLQNLNEGNRNLDARTQQQAASTEEISTAIEELSSSVAQSAEHASITTRRADEVRNHAEEGAKLIFAAEEKMAAISQASEAIAEIIGVVDEIAFTTNLLALNAAVEAARAGEHGRGFAVVASEVRRLAQSSASNAKGIKKLIAQSTSLITEGSALSSQSAQSFAAILKGIQEVSDRVSQMARATSSQGQASAQLTDAIMDVSRNTQANSVLVEENSTACASLAEQAEQLEELAGMFRVG